MTFDPFEIVVVPFPFTDKAAAKRRPALVVSSSAFNDAHEQLILAMITTKGRWPSDVPLKDWQAAGLNVPCRVRMKLFTLDQPLVLKRLGMLSNDDRSAIQSAIRFHLAIGL